MELVYILAIPFAGTLIGAACAFTIGSGDVPARVFAALTGFAAGVMTAASVFSLLLPAMDIAEETGRSSLVAVLAGLAAGVAFLLVLEHFVRFIKCRFCDSVAVKSAEKQGISGRNGMLLLALALHNIPEGMAVGASYAGSSIQENGVSFAGALVLCAGIAIQNLPESAVIALPLAMSGMKRRKAFFFSLLSGVAEPVAAVVTMSAAGFFTPLLPYLLCFASAAMLYVAVQELIPEMYSCGKNSLGIISFTAGFAFMAALDIIFG